MINTKAERFLKDSEFLKVLGQLPPKSKERYEYLQSHEMEKEEVRRNIIYVRCPYLDSEYMQSQYGKNASSEILLASSKDRDLDYELLQKHIDGAFRNWHQMEKKTKSFRNYVLYYYGLEQQKNEIEENSWKAASSYVRRLTRVVKRLSKNGGTVAEIIETLAESRKYEKVNEETWRKVEDECCKSPTVLSLNYEYKSGDWFINHLNGQEVDINAGLMESIEGAMEDASLYCEKAVAHIRDCESIKIRERLCCAYSSMILKTLKYENHKKIESEPAVSSVGYMMWEKEKVRLMHFIFEKEYIEFLIQDTPKSLNEYDGICWNLMYDNREIDNKNLLEYLNQKRVERGEKSISESALSQWLTSHNVSFSGYNTEK